jgi:signal transduction histidine kinase
MSATESSWTSRARAVSVALVVTNLLAVPAVAGWETTPIHLLLAAACLAFAVRPPRAISSRDALGFAVALTLAMLGNELLEGIEPVNDVYESWLVFVLVLGLGLLAVRRAQIASELKTSLEERVRLLGRQEHLINDLSHELRTPATIARGHLELLQRSGGDGSPEAVADIALDELARIDRIVERLLLLARTERQKPIEVGEIPTEPFLEDVLLRWSETAERVWRLGPVPRGSLRADPEALRIALDALLENAVKYTETGDSIELQARADEDRIVIEVTDSGSGVPLDAAETIFDRSARTPGDDRAGLGIGLAIVDAIARAHGGSCSLEPSAVGSTFALTLPGYRPDGVSPSGD